MNYFNAHTHYLPIPDSSVEALYNLSWEELSLFQCQASPLVYYTGGIHPCEQKMDETEEALHRLDQLLRQGLLSAIGECGLDRLSPNSLQWQTALFREQLLLAKHYQKPLVIHCVKAYDLLLAELKQADPDLPILLHGYRGGLGLTRQLLKTPSFYFSLGFRYSSDALHTIPLDRLFLETDVREALIEPLYHEIATQLQLPVDRLVDLLDENKKRFLSLS